LVHFGETEIFVLRRGAVEVESDPSDKKGSDGLANIEGRYNFIQITS